MMNVERESERREREREEEERGSSTSRWYAAVLFLLVLPSSHDSLYTKVKNQSALFPLYYTEADAPPSFFSIDEDYDTNLSILPNLVTFIYPDTSFKFSNVLRFNANTDLLLVKRASSLWRSVT